MAIGPPRKVVLVFYPAPGAQAEFPALTALEIPGWLMC